MARRLLLLMSVIYGGVLERYPRVRVMLGEAGIGWIPYILWRMDGEREDQFKDLSLTMPPSLYWRRQCWATYQTDPVGLKLVDELGADRIMWGSDFPHPDGIWPDSREYIAREMAHLSPDVRHKIVCGNAAHLFTRERFAQMQRHAILINVTRGEIVRGEDVLAAVNEGLIWGAGLDVTDPEPLPRDHPLWRHRGSS